MIMPRTFPLVLVLALALLPHATSIHKFLLPLHLRDGGALPEAYLAQPRLIPTNADASQPFVGLRGGWDPYLNDGSLCETAGAMRMWGGAQPEEHDAKQEKALTMKTPDTREVLGLTLQGSPEKPSFETWKGGIYTE